MNFQDYFKKSVWSSFMEGQGLTGDFAVKIIVAMVLAVVLGWIIYRIYGIYFSGVVYSRSFAASLMGVTVLTSMLTLAISSNIVISLGMVGALSIVRYRTAIKDPMDLLYIFWAISIGITLGAGLYLLAAVTMVIMFLIIHFTYNHQNKGVVYIMVVHYNTEMAGDSVMRSIGNIKHQLKSKTFRGESTEMTVELFCRNNNTIFLEKIKEIEGVQDVTLIQYNGEYHG